MRSSLTDMLPGRGREGARPLPPSRAMSCRTRRCCVGSKWAHPSTRGAPAGRRDVPRLSPCRPLFVKDGGVRKAPTVN